MILLAMLLIYAIIIGIPAALTVLNLFNLFSKRKINPIVLDVLTFAIGAFFMIQIYRAWNPVDWQEPLRLGTMSGGEAAFHAPVASWHLPALISLAAISLAGYVLLRIRKTRLPPLFIALCIAAMYIGCALSILWTLQLIPILNKNAFHPAEGYAMILFPLNFIILSASLIRGIVLERNEYAGAEEHKKHLLGRCDQFLQRSAAWPVAAFILMWPLTGAAVLILVLFGQRPDAAIKAFTQTSDWFFSQMTSPPNIYYDAHYLCTVAAGGHPRLVRPQRLGWRHNHKIIVNRQLCIANAFEELIAQRAPGFHRIVRHVYDRYGFPIARHIKTPIAADITYILMKPLEYLFLLVLYLSDMNPENRIARQYLPREKF